MNNTSQQHTSFKQLPQNSNGPDKSAMKILLDLIGYQYYTSRAAFEYEGSEIAFVNDGLLGRVRIYVDGDQKVSRFASCGTIRTNTGFAHQGKQLRIKSNCTGWFKSSQKISLWDEETEVDTKYDPGFTVLKWYQKVHFIGGAMLMGMAIGVLVQTIL